MFVPQSKRKLQTKLPVVIELGSLNIRAGFAGYDAPNYILPSDYVLEFDESNQSQKVQPR